MNEIVDGFAYAMSDRGRTCSMVSVINEATTEERNRTIRIQGQSKMAELLENGIPNSGIAPTS